MFRVTRRGTAVRTILCFGEQEGSNVLRKYREERKIEQALTANQRKFESQYGAR